ncbi:MAG TPA: hypothetical protein VNT75_18970 [Symbiobacteriaceae bacterium]|nr:hypothetical protein [Symbiobacteriaceae bacterium]
MGKLHSLRGGGGGRRPEFTSQLMARQPSWEIRQIYGADGGLAGDLILLYTPRLVRGVVILRSVPPDSEWEALDTWVLGQIDNYERRYVVDYYEGTYVTGVEGPPERPDDLDFEE